jgi:hypothetical protein
MLNLLQRVLMRKRKTPGLTARRRENRLDLRKGIP